MYTIARIHSEIFEQTKLLPSNTILDVDFDRHDSDFLLLTKHNDRNYILKMESCELLTRLVDMDEEITAEIDLVSISGRSMLYPVCRVKMMYYSCRANVVDLSNFNLLTMEGNLLPHRIIVVMVREEQCMVIIIEILSIINISIWQNFLSKLVQSKFHFLN